MAVTNHRNDAGQLDNDLVPSERRYLFIEPGDSDGELIASNRMEEILVILGHLFCHVPQVLSPLFGLGVINDEVRPAGLSNKRTGKNREIEKHEYETTRSCCHGQKPFVRNPFRFSFYPS